jgi:glycosyltransferase involved in cell wall biosynthesis
VEEYYRVNHGTESVCIPYGAPLEKSETTDALRSLNLTPNDYWLYVTRFEPENNPLLVREVFETVETSRHLVLVGDAPYAAEYIAAVRATNDPRIHLPGSIYGTGYHELQSHCFGYIHATEVGGTHPALIEAMGKGNLVLYLNTPENAEVAADAGIPFEKETLAETIRLASALSEAEQLRFRRAAQDRVRRLYGWDAITVLYEELFEKLRTRKDPLTVQWNPR